MLLLSYSTPAFASYNGGLLKAGLISTHSSVDSAYPSTNSVDGNLATYTRLVGTSSYIVYTFAEPMDLTRVYSKVGDTYSLTRFYDASNTVIHTRSLTNASVDISLKGVKKIVINCTFTQGYLYEFDVYGAPAVPPSTPSDLSVSGTENAGTLSWTSVSNVTSYNVYDNATLVDTTTETTYTFSNLSIGTHNLTVSAVNTNGESTKATSVVYIVSAPNDSQGIPITATIEPTITLTVNNAFVSFGEVSSIELAYEKHSAVTLNINSNCSFKLEFQANSDFHGSNGNILTIDKLKVKKHSDSIYVTPIKNIPTVILSSPIPVTDQIVILDFKLDTGWSAKNDSYATTVNFVATQI